MIAHVNTNSHESANLPVQFVPHVATALQTVQWLCFQLFVVVALGAKLSLSLFVRALWTGRVTYLVIKNLSGLLMTPRL